MSSTDGINRGPKIGAELPVSSTRPAETKSLPRTAEDYVAIENRLAAQKGKPTQNPQLNSIFDELRGRLPK